MLKATKYYPLKNEMVWERDRVVHATHPPL